MNKNYSEKETCKSTMVSKTSVIVSTTDFQKIITISIKRKTNIQETR